MVIHPVGERQWEDINWNGQGHRSCVNMELGTFCQLLYLGMVPTSGGTHSKPDAEPTLHHLDDAGNNYLEVCNFSNFQTILHNCITNDFLQQGYIQYGPPLLFPRPTTPGDPSTSRVDSS
jgi:hypothetical protein